MPFSNRKPVRYLVQGRSCWKHSFQLWKLASLTSHLLTTRCSAPKAIGFASSPAKLHRTADNALPAAFPTVKGLLASPKLHDTTGNRSPRSLSCNSAHSRMLVHAVQSKLPLLNLAYDDLWSLKTPLPVLSSLNKAQPFLLRKLSTNVRTGFGSVQPMDSRTSIRSQQASAKGQKEVSLPMDPFWELYKRVSCGAIHRYLHNDTKCGLINTKLMHIVETNVPNNLAKPDFENITWLFIYLSFHTTYLMRSWSRK